MRHPYVQKKVRETHCLDICLALYYTDRCFGTNERIHLKGDVLLSRARHISVANYAGFRFLFTIVAAPWASVVPRGRRSQSEVAIFMT